MKEDSIADLVRAHIKKIKKMKKNNIRFLVFFIGVATGFSLSLFGGRGHNSNENSYIKLKTDLCIEDFGYLQKGTLIRFDEAFPEGFSRYILYLNFPSAFSGEIYQPEHEDEIIPYWLRHRDSTCISFEN